MLMLPLKSAWTFSAGGLANIQEAHLQAAPATPLPPSTPPSRLPHDWEVRHAKIQPPHRTAHLEIVQLSAVSRQATLSARLSTATQLGHS